MSWPGNINSTIHEYLPRHARKELKQVGWSKAVELVKVTRSDGVQFDCATWLHRAQELSEEQFKCEVEKHLTDKEIEPWEIIYFKLYKSQLPVSQKRLFHGKAQVLRPSTRTEFVHATAPRLAGIMLRAPS